MWQLVTIVGTAGAIYWKVKGYSFNDLVYVSKKHFSTVTESLVEHISAVSRDSQKPGTELSLCLCSGAGGKYGGQGEAGSSRAGWVSRD